MVFYLKNPKSECFETNLLNLTNFSECNSLRTQNEYIDHLSRPAIKNERIDHLIRPPIKNEYIDHQSRPAIKNEYIDHLIRPAIKNEYIDHQFSASNKK